MVIGCPIRRMRKPKTFSRRACSACQEAEKFAGIHYVTYGWLEPELPWFQISEAMRHNEVASTGTQEALDILPLAHRS
jgi:hypothetical protein